MNSRFRIPKNIDAVAIPYKVGDQMRMVNQDGDTIHFIQQTKPARSL